ncbi:MAG: N-acyl-D-amino-acid deacylase family protein [bacterium]
MHAEPGARPASASADFAGAQPRPGLVISNATILDGSGAPRFAGDVAIDGDRVTRIAAPGTLRGGASIDATGLALAPGFIDVHTHDDRMLVDGGGMAPKVSQGVTTVIAGNCGISLAGLAVGAGRGGPPQPLDLLDGSGDWYRFPTFAAYFAALERQPAATNAAFLVGHSTLRAAAMDDLARAASPAECRRMCAAIDEAMQAGAIGLSTGTFYPPAAAAPTSELIELSRRLTDAGGLYVTHMRNEAEAILPAIDETLEIGRACGIGVVISHHKVAGLANHGRSIETLARIGEAMKRQPVALDCYPYEASSTVLSAVRLPMSSRVLVAWSTPHPECAGRDLAEIAAGWGVSAEAAVQRLQPAGAIYFMMDERDVQRILAFPETMIGSDGLPHDASPHPRLWGTFPRVLGHYSRDLGLFPLEVAVHKMTGLPAARFGLRGRGRIEPGAFADLVLFDPATVSASATFEAPVQPAAGIHTVMVNGTPVWRGGRATGERPGRVLRREGRA